MKITVSGRGFIPGVNALAPVRGVECDEKLVRRLLNYHQFRVYDTTTGLLITRANVDKMFEAAQPKQKPVETKPVVEAPKVEIPYVKPMKFEKVASDEYPVPVAETQKIDIVTKVEPKIESVPVEIVSTPVVEEVVEEVVETETTTDDVTPVDEETTDETVKKIPYKKKKNRH